MSEAQHYVLQRAGNSFILPVFGKTVYVNSLLSLTAEVQKALRHAPGWAGFSAVILGAVQTRHSVTCCCLVLWVGLFLGSWLEGKEMAWSEGRALLYRGRESWAPRRKMRIGWTVKLEVERLENGREGGGEIQTTSRGRLAAHSWNSQLTEQHIWKQQNKRNIKQEGDERAG